MSKEMFSNKLLFEDGDIENSKHDEIVAWCQCNIKEILQDIYPELYSRIIIDTLKTEWEIPLLDIKHVHVHGGTIPEKKPVGAIDLRCTFEFTSDNGKYNSLGSVNIEVKTKISGKTNTSLGSLIRQVNFYEIYLKKMYPYEHSFFLACSPSEKYKVIYESNKGKKFLVYQPGKYSKKSPFICEYEVEEKKEIALNLFDAIKNHNESELKLINDSREKVERLISLEGTVKISQSDSKDILTNYFN